MKALKYSLIGLLVSFRVAAEEDKKTSLDPVSSFFKRHHLSIRESAYDQSGLSRPARFLLTSPDSKEESIAADVGLVWNFLLQDGAAGPPERKPAWLTLGLLGEFHRNDLSDSEKDSYQTGLTFSREYVNINSGFISNIYGKVVYKRDNLNNSDGTLAEVLWAPFVGRKLLGGNPKDLSHFNIGGVFGHPNLLFQFQPSLGFQYENSDNVFDLKTSGDSLRLKGQAGLNIYPFAQSFIGRASDSELANPDAELSPLVVSLDYTYWNALNRSGGFNETDSYYRLFRGSIDYFFGSYDPDAKRRPFAIGVDYLNGENPEEGYLSEEYWQLSLKFQF